MDTNGLDLDYSSWAKLNKEILIRDYIRKRRKHYGETGIYYTYEHPFAPALDEPIYDEERALAQTALDCLVDDGLLSCATWLPTKEETRLKKALKCIRRLLDNLMERMN